MAPLRVLSVTDLLQLYLSFGEANRKASGAVPFALSVSIIHYFLGAKWIKNHLDTSVLPDGFMRLDLRNPAIGHIQLYKVVDLAELLFNLQGIGGFAACVTHMRTEALVEASLAELDIARMLHVHNYQFNFNEQKGVRGSDYDLEIKLDKWDVCADVKCKIEDTPIGANTIMGSLKKSRTQLPANKPGMLLVKVPQNWMNKYLYAQLMADSARRFLVRDSERIVSVKFYIAPFEEKDGDVSQTHKFMELANTRNRFDRHRKWELFTRRGSTGLPPTMLTAMPPKWLRLMNFPDSINDYAGGGG
jgi:hypothetical protein